MSFDPKRLEQCVGCGLCLSSCPTFDITRREEHGPRGRIEGMRLVQSEEFDLLDAAVVDSFESCVQCRACEDVCPSDVEFGALMEQARSDLVAAQHAQGAAREPDRLAVRGLLAVVRRPLLLRLATAVLVVLQRTGLQRLLPSRMRVARRVSGPTARRAARRAPAAADTQLFRGCIMDQWFAEVHEASERVLTALGRVVDSRRRSACCGALHLHAGDHAAAVKLAERTVAAYAGTAGEIVVNSAGCGAAMREYGRLLGTPEATAFAERVRDLAELVSVDVLAAGGQGGSTVPDRRVVWQAPCHLRFVQGVDDASLRALQATPGLEVVEPDDDHRCCGAGGAYSVTQPELSEAILARKSEALRATEATVVASANPGCMLQLARAGHEVVHVAELLADGLQARD